MSNLDLYNKYAQPPQDALKSFSNGRFKGTDINPMWRIKALTEHFGPCGLGWYTKTTRMWREDCKDGTAAVFCEVELYVKYDGEWSAPIVGVGGNTLERVTTKEDESKKKYTVTQVSDEAYKMAYTDALGIACKALGIGADIWWKSSDGSKYAKYMQADTTPPEGYEKTTQPSAPIHVGKVASVPPPAPVLDRRAHFDSLKDVYGVDDKGITTAINKAVESGIVTGLKGDIGSMSDADFIRLMDGASTVLKGMTA